MSGFIGFVGVAGLIGSIILSVLDPNNAVGYITTGIASCIGCFLIVHILGILYDIRDSLQQIKQNTKKEEPKDESGKQAVSYIYAPKKSTGWTCKACGASNSTTASYCKGCGKDR